MTDLTRISAAEVADLEPELTTVGALVSPSSGIVDTHGLMLAYQGEMEDHGGMVAFNSPVTGGEVTGDGIVIETGGAGAVPAARQPGGQCRRPVRPGQSRG